MSWGSSSDTSFGVDQQPRPSGEERENGAGSESHVPSSCRGQRSHNGLAKDATQISTSIENTGRSTSIRTRHMHRRCPVRTFVNLYRTECCGQCKHRRIGMTHPDRQQEQRGDDR
jgi:hypothetical protein